MRLISFGVGVLDDCNALSFTKVMEPLDCPRSILSRKAMRLLSTTR